MSVRLTLQHDGQTRTLVLGDGSHVIGAGEQADAVAPLPTMSRIHARIDVDGERVCVVDLGSSNGTRLGETPVGTSDAVPWEQRVIGHFGQVRVRWDPLGAGDDEPALLLEATGPEPDPIRQTLGDSPLDDFTRKALAPLLEQLANGAERGAFARALGEALFRDLPVDAVAIRDDEAVLFSAGDSTDEATLHAKTASGIHIVLRPRTNQRRETVASVLAAACAMLDLAAERVVPEGAAPEPDFPAPETLDPAMRKLYHGAARAAAGGLNILIHGESGTGKEVLARTIHREGAFAGGPFVALNCAALPEDLLEAELFGIERGVATGVTARPGKFELADGGILFLDEIGDMPPATQARILRVLQEGEVVRLGASAPRRITVQVVSATNRDLGAMVTSGEFRLDLYHRLADWEATIPPLRDRRVDIPNLALFFLERSARELSRAVRGISQRALDQLLRYRWPGNVRELEREMKRLAAFADAGQLLTSEDLAERIRAGEGTTANKAGTLVRRLAEEERRIIRQALADAGGNASQAARDLGISRATLYRRFAELGIHPSGPENPQPGES